MNLDFGFYWRLFRRRLPVMAFLFLLCGSIGLTLAIKLPTVYESQALLMVEEPEIPTELASTTVRSTPAEEIQVIQQQLMSRANLIEIANKFPIFSNIRAMSPDEVVEEMNRRTSIFISGGGNRRNASGPTLVSVKFEAGTGEIASKVVNEYVTQLIEASVRGRTGQAEDTLKFFEQEAERLDQELSERSARITEFQSRNSEALPDSINYRMGRQTMLLERLTESGRERAGLIERREQLIDMFEATGQVGSARSTPELSPAERALQDLEDELKRALTVYSETNPRVVQLRRRIELQRNELAAEQAEATGEGLTARDLLDLQLADIDQQISTLDQEITRSETELEETRSEHLADTAKHDHARCDATRLREYPKAVRCHGGKFGKGAPWRADRAYGPGSARQPDRTPNHPQLACQPEPSYGRGNRIWRRHRLGIYLLHAAGAIEPLRSAAA